MCCKESRALKCLNKQKYKNGVNRTFLLRTMHIGEGKCNPDWPPLWSSGRSFWLEIQRSRVRSPALPDFLSSSGSGTGSHSASWGQLRSYLNEKSSGSRSRKQRLTAVGNRCADHVTPLYPQKLALTSSTGGGRSVGIVRVRTKATELKCNPDTVITDPDSQFCMAVLILTFCNFLIATFLKIVNLLWFYIHILQLIILDYFVWWHLRMIVDIIK